MSSRRSSIANDKQNPISSHSQKNINKETEVEEEYDFRIMNKSLTDLRLTIYVVAITGTTFKLEVFPSDTIFQIKQQLETTEGIPVSQQHLIWKYEVLQNELSIENYGIVYGSRLRLIVGLTTGPISKTPIIFNKSKVKESTTDENSNESKSLTVFFVHNLNQLKVFTITTNDNIIPDESHSNYFDTNKGSETTMTNELKDIENRELKEKMTEIQNRMKLLLTKRKDNKVIDKQTFKSIISEGVKLPHLKSNLCDNPSKSRLQSDKSKTKCEIHLPPISNTSALFGNQSKQTDKNHLNFVKQELIQSNGRQILSSKRPKSLSFSRKDVFILKEESNDNIITKCVGTKIFKLRPPTAPSAFKFNNFDINFFINPSNINSVDSNLKSEKDFPFKRINQNSKQISNCNDNTKLPQICNNTKKTIRCYSCGVKLGIVNRFECRCGHIFCIKHRYSETHLCSFDYKEEGRKFLKHNNPIISSNKLPKI